jgi:dihydroorotate dehydrogenase
MGGTFAYGLFRDYTPSFLFHDVWLRLLLPSSPPPAASPLLSTDCFSLSFPSPIGAGPGLDPDAIGLRGLLSLGLGFVDVGPVAPSSEGSTLAPYRVTASSVALAHPERSSGAVFVRRQLALCAAGPRGATLVPLEENVAGLPHLTDDDYLYLFMKLCSVADFLTLSLSPTPFRKLQYYSRPFRLNSLIDKVIDCRDIEIGLKTAADCGLVPKDLEEGAKGYVPVMIRVNEMWEDVEGLVRVCGEKGVDGVVVGSDKDDKNEARAMLEKAYRAGKGKVVLVSYGGIDSGAEVLERVRRGASLVQLFSVMLTQGPGQAARIRAELEAELNKYGYKNIKEAFGTHYE